MELEFNLEHVKEAAQKIWAYAGNNKVWAFHGEMGAGKTTFIHALCEVLGVTSAIGSPTYSIINEYESTAAGTILHMDWYRLKSEEEAVNAGVEDAVYSGNYCFIEWPDRAPAILPDDVAHITITLVPGNLRNITVKAQ